MIKVFLLAMLFSCSPKSREIGIQVETVVVKFGKSYKIDLGKETYTVYFMNGTTYDGKFNLSEKDKQEILEMFQQCGISGLKGNIQVKGKCDFFPAVFTEMSFSVGRNDVQISLDESCNKHPLFKGRQSKRILKFLSFVRKKVFSKPEVAKAPQTDMIYM